MNIAIIFPLLAFIGGAMTAFQPLINSKLTQHLTSPIWGSFVSFVVGTVALLILGLIISGGKFMQVDMDGVKWWMWTGGLLGAVFVTVAIYVVPYMGVAAMIAVMIAGQLVMAAILDHFGILANAPNPITWQKFLGLTLLCIGAIITLKYK
jgi:transporter family-2 protein